MYRKIIVGYDGSDQAEDALALGTDLSQASGAELCAAGVFLVHTPLRSGADPVDREAEQEFAEQLKQAAEPVDAATQLVHSSSPARGLHEYAEEIGADLIVVGSSRHGRAGQTLLGNVAVSLMHGSPCAVGIAPRGYADRTDRGVSTIVVGYDASPEARLALERAYQLSRATGALVRLVSVAQPPEVAVGKSGGANYGWKALKETTEEAVRVQLSEARDSAPDDVEVEPVFLSGKPAEELAEAARPLGSVLVLGSRAYGPLRRVLLGSVSRALADIATAPMLVHPRGMREQRTAERPAEAGATA